MVGNSTHHLEHFVEFFFILAGFFIFRHFQKPTFFRQGIEKKAQNALAYTWKRFLSLMPYVIPIVIISSTIIFIAEYTQNHWTGGLINNFRDIINEVLLLPTGIMTRKRVIGPIWYLSVMIFIMPLISLIAQSKRQNLFVLISMPIIWLVLHNPTIFTYYGTNSYFSLLRGLFAMSLGGVVFYLANLISSKESSNKTRILFTLLEVSLYLYAAAIGYFNLRPVELCIVVLFFAALITLSGLSCTSKLRCKLFNYLGAISLPLFMWHFGVIRIMQALSINFGGYKNIIFIAGISILLSAIHYQIVQKILLRRRHRK